MNAKKTLSMTLAAAMAAGLLAGCGEKKQGDTEDPSAKKLTVGLALTGINSNAVFIDMRKDIEARCNEAGYKLMTADIEGGASQIVTALENFINGGCDIIILQNSAEEAYADLLKQAVEKGVIVASYDYESDIAQYACICSNYEVGKVIGQEMGKFCNENEGSGKVAICSYSALDFLVERERGMRDGFAEVCPDGEIVMAQDAGFANEGVIAGENFLQAIPDIQGVMGINDGGVLGVYEAENTDRIRGAKILLIDDILTTGATLGECVRVLREAGAADVVCATLARAVTEKEKDGARRGTPV